MDMQMQMKPHEDPCPICEEYIEKVRGLVNACCDTKEQRYYKRLAQVLDTVVKEHERRGISSPEKAAN